MNRKELVSAIAEKAALSKKEAENFLNAFVEVVSEELKRNGSVNLVGFGSFKVSQRAAREARNPATGEKIHVPAKRVPVFKPGKDLKAALS
ncbi:MAG: HU family DNA-binding protein [Calditrichaeota bacterium]|nr:MAG: HU family DNA-binding protein [Calditrichota bacterium]